jgi:hypothetical protein
MEANEPSGAAPEPTTVRVVPDDEAAGDGPTKVEVVLPIGDDDLVALDEDTKRWSRPCLDEENVPTMLIELPEDVEIPIILAEPEFAEPPAPRAGGAPLQRFAEDPTTRRILRVGVRALLAVVVIGGVFGGLDWLTSPRAAVDQPQITILAEAD